LQEFADVPTDRQSLLEAAREVGTLDDQFFHGMVRSEGQPLGTHLRLAHSTVQEAIDRCLSDATSELVLSLSALYERNEWVSGAYRKWKAVHDVRRGVRTVPEVLTSDDQSELMPVLLAASPDPALLPLLTEHCGDFWSFKDLAFEVVRLWPDFKKSGGGR